MYSCSFCQVGFEDTDRQSVKLIFVSMLLHSAIVFSILMVQVSPFEKGNPFHNIYHRHEEDHDSKKTGHTETQHTKEQIKKEKDFTYRINTEPDNYRKQTVFFRPYYWLLRARYFATKQSTFVNGDYWLIKGSNLNVYLKGKNQGRLGQSEIYHNCQTTVIVNKYTIKICALSFCFWKFQTIFTKTPPSGHFGMKHLIFKLWNDVNFADHGHLWSILEIDLSAFTSLIMCEKLRKFFLKT